MSQSPDIIVAVGVYGGLGHDQTEAVQTRLAAIPGVVVFSPPPSIMGDWTEDSHAISQRFDRASIEHPTIRKRAIIQHSLSADHAWDYANLYAVEYMGLIEPVTYGPDRQMPAKCPCVDVFWSDAMVDFPLIDISGITHRIINGTNHNTICQSSELIEALEARIRALLS